MSSMFPVITIKGDRVDATAHVEEWTGFVLFFGFFVSVFAMLFATLITYGIALVIMAISPFFIWYFRKKSAALIHGSGVHVNAVQFPEIHQCVEDFKTRLNLAEEIDVYIVESYVANAFVVKFGRKNVVLLTDDLVQGCLMSGRPHALAFIIGHELAHIALKHNRGLRLWMRNFKTLSRKDEYSADSVATALVADRTIAFHGLLLLTVGYAMMPYINPHGILRQVQQVKKNKYSKKAERDLTHPLLMNRLERVLR